MALTCASARLGLCLMADAPIPLICGGNNTGLRHKCSQMLWSGSRQCLRRSVDRRRATEAERNFCSIRYFLPSL